MPSCAFTDSVVSLVHLNSSTPASTFVAGHAGMARLHPQQGFDVGMYREEELVNSFHLADLDQSGMITCEQCKEGTGGREGGMVCAHGSCSSRRLPVQTSPN
eukprot:GHVU01152150.1.p2 GENE.GHVU01152150.1~~GHVU01152150.1.p2  ORF type:complete len:102 (+),score=12.63 GHVU01152150.1:176-481(+)